MHPNSGRQEIFKEIFFSKNKLNKQISKQKLVALIRRCHPVIVSQRIQTVLSKHG
jgi:hypothetical protein